MHRFILILAFALLAASVAAQPTVVNSFPTSPFGSVFPGGLGYDSQNDQLWVIDETNKAAYQVTRTGSPVSTLDLNGLGITFPIGAGVDGKGQRLYVAEEINDRVWEIDLANRTVITMINTTYSDPSGLDYNPLGHTVVTSDDAADLVHEIDIATWTAISTLSTSGLGSDGDGLGVNTYNGLYLLGDDTGALLNEVADDGYVMNTWNTKTYGIQDPEGVCMDPKNGNYFISTTVAPDTIYEVAGGLRLGPALTADRLTINKGETVTFTCRADPQRWPFGGMAVVGLGGGSVPPVIVRQGSANTRGHVRWSFKNPGLGGVKATLLGAGIAVQTAQLTNTVDVTLN